jgi:cytochrome c-type biogenesis protein CcmH
MRSSAVVAIAAVLLVACGPSTPEERRRAAIREVEERVLAPCCWMGTIDVHESPVAHQLRDEVAARIDRGETAEQILDDLVVRYGDRVRSTPPSGALPAVLFIGGLLAFIVVVLVALRWVRRGRRSAAAVARPATPRQAGDDALDDQLDDELARLD